MDAISLAEHLVRQDVTDLEKDIARDFLLNPSLFTTIGPVVAALDLDVSFHSQLTTDEHIYVGLLLTLTDQALIIVHDTLLCIYEEIFQSVLRPRVKWYVIFSNHFQSVVVHIIELVDVDL